MASYTESLSSTFVDAVLDSPGATVLSDVLRKAEKKGLRVPSENQVVTFLEAAALVCMAVTAAVVITHTSSLDAIANISDNVILDRFKDLAVGLFTTLVVAPVAGVNGAAGTLAIGYGVAGFIKENLKRPSSRHNNAPGHQIKNL